MGAPTSSLLSETYLQFLEHAVLSDILIQHNILGYFRYIDDILIVYRENHTYILEVLDLFNTAVTALLFTMEQEDNNSINFLDITVYKSNNSLNFCVYRKSTATDHIIPRNSNHPPEHKRSAVNYLSRRLVSYPLKGIDRQCEYEIVKNILHNDYCNAHS
jgi:hypothetical protein